MDHIIPRKGEGSTNTRDNLVAICSVCNRAKGKRPFLMWAQSQSNPEISLEKATERIRHWITAPGETRRDQLRLAKSVRARLERTELDDPIDARSLESVAWMATEVAERMRQHFKRAGAGTEVNVYRGAITAEARKAAGIEKQLPYIGADGTKNRLDRRHHAVDAAVVAIMERSAAMTLAERMSLRDAERLAGTNEQWKLHPRTGEKRVKFDAWAGRMQALADLLVEAMTADRIPVMQNLRLGLGNGEAHDATIRPLQRIALGSAMDLDTIDRASTPALWVALTRHPDFDPATGLPENPDRTIWVNGQRYLGDDAIGFFPTLVAAIPVRGGYAEIGNTIHHARVYRIPGNKKATYGMVRVFTTDLLPHRHDDLFTAPLPPQSISLRTAVPAVRQAVVDGTAEYLGWLVVGDELLLDVSTQDGQVAAFLEEYPQQTRWRLSGFMSPKQLRLRPLMMAAEGLGDSQNPVAVKVVDRPGWLPSANVLFNPAVLQAVVQRDALGVPRLGSKRSLPVSWNAR